MGIRFYCPNGHKLNVKSFQAGRRGICPYCGVSMMIPTESTAPAGKGRRASVEEHGTQPATLGTPTAAGWSAAPTPLESPVLSAPAEPLAAAAMTPANVNAMSAPAAPADPLTEAPTAVWYVRPAGGGQYGPATGEIMRCWLSEGRIGADSLVWREGWHDWQEASQVFPQLKPNDMTPLLSEKAATSPSVSPPSATRRSGVPMAAIVGVLAVAVVALVIVLLMILFQQSPVEPESKPDTRDKAAMVAPLDLRETRWI